MNALGHFLEDEGIATTGISLVREHTERMRPPRLLWVPFPLGRPLGSPGDADFQHRVIAAALALLDAESGPVLADFSEEAGADSSQVAAWSCPVSFPRVEKGSSRSMRVRAELSTLAPWYERARARRGRTTVGASGLDPEEVVELLIAFVEDPSAFPAEPAAVLRLKHATEDLKAYYLEAAAERPGEREIARVYRWLWDDTEAGSLLHAVGDTAARASHPLLRALGERAIVPRAARERRRKGEAPR